jgi:alpha-glucosidase
MLWKVLLLASAARAASLADCPGYEATNVFTSNTGLRADLKLAGTACNVYGTDLTNLTLDVTYENENRLHVKIQDPGNQVYQVPELAFSRPSGSSNADSSNLKFDYVKKPFSFKVSRSGSGEVLFDSSAAKLVFESQYIRLRTKLPQNPNLYGLGEHSDPLRLKTSNYGRTFWAQDSFAIPEGSNLYGTQPFYIDHRETGTHGVFLLNSNGMDVNINNSTQDGQYLEYNALGGVFDFWFVAGPSPHDVQRQYADLVGRPALTPYWGLGLHQCRYGAQDIFHTAEIAANYSRANIPVETIWSDIDYMDRRRVFSVDPQRYPLATVRDFVKYLHDHNQHYIVMVDPAVAYQDYGPANRGLVDNAFLRRSNGSAWLGVVWPGVTVFPDWFATNITKYWNGEFERFFNPDTGVDIDGLWIDMNEPSNFPCFFPCNDPYSAAKGYPPAAPAVRQNPRPLPGFPCSLQPKGVSCSREAPLEVSAVEKPLLDRDEDRLPSVELQDIEDPVLLEGRQSGNQKGLPGRDLLYPKYAIHNKAAWRDDWNAAQGGISNKTINTNILSQNGLAQYDTHNLYGAMMGSASYDAMLARRPGRRPFIISRSTFPGGGTRVGHWLGDNRSIFTHYRKSIRTLLNFSAFFQFPMTGSDVCGFDGDTTEELCARWASLGAFSPFYRNHNRVGMKDQEFYRWASVAESARKAIDIRYRLLDYFYTYLRKNSADGTPATTPMFFEYPKDKATWGLELQYFYGPGILVAPVTDEGATSVNVYLPKDTFYDWYTHEPICGKGATYRFTDQGITDIPLLIRSGVILPVRTAAGNTTADVRKNDFELIVPLRPDGTAEGELYLDDGDSLDSQFTLVNLRYEDGKVIAEGTFDYEVDVVVSKITVLGADGDVCGNSAGAEPVSIEVNLSLNEPFSVDVV